MIRCRYIIPHNVRTLNLNVYYSCMYDVHTDVTLNICSVTQQQDRIIAELCCKFFIYIGLIHHSKDVQYFWMYVYFVISGYYQWHCCTDSGAQFQCSRLLRQGKETLNISLKRRTFPYPKNSLFLIATNRIITNRNISGIKLSKLMSNI